MFKTSKQTRDEDLGVAKKQRGGWLNSSFEVEYVIVARPNMGEKKYLEFLKLWDGCRFGGIVERWLCLGHSDASEFLFFLAIRRSGICVGLLPNQQAHMFGQVCHCPYQRKSLMPLIKPRFLVPWTQI